MEVDILPAAEEAKLPSLKVKQKEPKLDIPETNLPKGKKRKINTPPAKPVFVLAHLEEEKPAEVVNSDRVDMLRLVLVASGLFIAGYFAVKGFKHLLSNIGLESVPIEDIPLDG
jgi:hypothetical protein